MNRPLLALACANFAVGTGALVIAGILKPLAGDLGISLAQAGQLISVYALAYAISSPLLTAGLGTWQSKKVLLAGLALLFAGNLWGALSSGYSVLFLSRIAAACGGGLVTPAAGAIAASLVEPAQRVKALAIVFAGLTLATVLGVPLGTYVGLHSAWQGALVVALLFAAGATAAVILAVPGRLAVPRSNLRVWGQLLKNGSLMFVVFTFITPLLQTEAGQDATGVTALLLWFGVASVLGNVLVAKASARFGLLWPMGISLLILAATLAGFSLLPMSGFTAAVLLAFWGIAGYAFPPLQQARLIALAPAGASAVLALNASALYIGVFAGAVAGGTIVHSVGLTRVGIAGAGLALATLIAFLASCRSGQTIRSVGKQPL